MKKELIIFFSIFLFFGQSFAEEPGWTDAQRTERRDIVIQGEVQSVEKKQNIDEFTDLYIAKIKVFRVYKGSAELKDKALEVYYELSVSGHPGARCPNYAKLKQGDNGKFFIRKCYEDWKKKLKLEEISDSIFLIEMGSDVQLKK